MLLHNIHAVEPQNSHQPYWQGGWNILIEKRGMWACVSLSFLRFMCIWPFGSKSKMTHVVLAGGGGYVEEVVWRRRRRSFRSNDKESDLLTLFLSSLECAWIPKFSSLFFFSHKHRDAWWKGKKSEQHNNTHSNHKDNEYVCSGGGTKIRHKQCVHAYGTWHPRRGTADERTTWIHASLLLTAMKKGDHITHHIQGRLPSFSWFSRIVNIPAS